MEIILVSLYSYFSGSIPFGLILIKFFKKKDITKIGSGNIGATNVLRTSGKLFAFITLLLDIIKGFIPTTITIIYFNEYIQISCLMTFLGHIFPVWLKFKGGKGVATYLGILFAVSIQLSLLFIVTWIVILFIFKYASLASMFSSLTVFVVTFIKDNILKSIDPNLNIDIDLRLILFIFLILIIYTHRKNILNLKNKSEQKIKI